MSLSLMEITYLFSWQGDEEEGDEGTDYEVNLNKKRAPKSFCHQGGSSSDTGDPVGDFVGGGGPAGHGEGGGVGGEGGGRGQGGEGR